MKPVTTRVALEVRNHLIFLLGGGSGQPANPRYTMSLAVTSTVAPAAVVQSTSDSQVTSSVANVTASYVLIDTATNERVATGTRRVSAAFDVPRQEFAGLRARRDAENRAAREAAEQVHLAVAQDLSRIGVQ